MSTDSTTPPVELTPRQTFSVVANNTARNVIVVGVGTLFLWWFSGIWALGAKIGFWMAVVFTGIEGIHAIVGTLLTLTLNAAGKPRPGEKWFISANGVQLAGVGLAVTLLVFLRSELWG